jgi:hypothetical protein
MARVVLIADTPAPADYAYRLQLADTAHEVLAVVLSSFDGRSCFEVGIDGSNIVIRRMTFAEESLSHTPPDEVLVTAAHGVAAAKPFTLEVRKIKGVITGYINGVLKVTFDNTDDEIYSGHKHFGFVSSIVGAKVLKAELFDVVPEVVNAGEILVAVCGGDVWFLDGANLWQQFNGIFNPTGQVAMVEFEQQAIGMDGAHAAIADPRAMNVEKLITTAGSLPGQTDPGTTRARVLAAYQGRVMAGGDPQDPQNLFGCAIADILDWLIGTGLPGAAFGLSASNRPKIGQPLRAAIQAARGSLVLGATGSFWEFVGDPALQGVTIDPLLLGNGVSGLEAMCLAQEGIIVAHSPDGVFVLPNEGEGFNLSEHVLTEGIQIPREDVDLYLVQVRRDTRRHLTHIFITPAVSGTALHFAYDERIGLWQRGRGGFFPETFPDRIGPTASCVWQGELIMGTRDGYLVKFDDEAKDDDGEAIECRFVCSLMKEQDLTHDTILRHLVIILSDGSDPVTWKIYGGATAEQAYAREARWLLASGTVGPGGKPIRRNVRAPALVLEISNSTAGESFSIEEIQVETEPGRLLTRRQRLAAPPPPPPAVSSTEEDTSESSSFASGPGNTSLSLSSSLPESDSESTGDSATTPSSTDTGGTGTPSLTAGDPTEASGSPVTTTSDTITTSATTGETTTTGDGTSTNSL